ncbi:LOW QUALITY PROTEIN: TOG array regulator of axonemal microtubules protein 2-like [Strix aluco]|uniref:LOW QUALITY PROTEIN: TOG array regulator of axonemal microtubules protein 2-like n=1 Tax=Strix aluco TaxID=111821 RepID=UPI003DA6B475
MDNLDAKTNTSYRANKKRPNWCSRDMIGSFKYCCWGKSRVALQLFVVKYVKRCSCCSGSAEFSGNHSSVLRWAQQQRPRDLPPAFGIYGHGFDRMLKTHSLNGLVAVTCTSCVIFPCRLSMLQRNPPAAVSGPATSSTSSRLSSAESPAPPPTMATQDDFAAAKYHTPVAVYCGSIPKFKPRYIALRGGSIDSNLQFCGSKWTTEEEDETVQIKDKLKMRRMSEDLLASHRELQTLEPILPVLQHRVDGGLKSSGHLCETVLSPLTGPALSQIKEVDHLMNPSLLSDDNLKYSNGRIHVTLSKSVQKKIDEKRMRQMEILRREREKEREKEKSLQLPTQSVDPGDTAKESFGPPPVNGTDFMSPSTSNAHGERAGTALRKRVNGPPLPSIPVISQGDSFPRKSSANSLLANDLDFLERGDDSECGDTWEARPVPKPQQELLKALTGLSSDDWEQKAKGLFSIRCLAVCHSEVLLSKLHAVSLAVTKEVNNLRSKVSQFAISTLGELFRTMKKHMDHEVDGIAQVLLQRMGDSSKFIQKAADQSLDIMVKSVTAARAMTALMASGVQHCNVLVRRCAAKHLLTAVERIGAGKLLSGARDRTELLVCTVVRFAQDCHPDTRSYGRKMLTVLMSHKNFDTYLKQSVPSRDLIDVMARLKQKGREDHKCDLPSVKAPRKSRKSSLMTAQQNLPSNESLKSELMYSVYPIRQGRTSLRAVEEADQLNELCNLLTAKDFQARREGVVLLLDHCKSSPRFVSTNIFQIFDVFVLRLQDCNKKVNQQALEVLALIIPVLRDALHPVLFSLVSAVIDNLNSKHSGIYAAAVKALEAAIAHLDNRLMLQAFGHRVRFLSGQALLDVTEHLSVLVASLYPSKPQAVKHYVLPILWFFLGNRALPVGSSNVRAVVAKLAKTLNQVMGLSLRDHAATQPQHVVKNLWNVLGLNIR